jgi:4'-phosphopantetheinyl transferase
MFSDFQQVAPKDLKYFSSVLTTERRAKANSQKLRENKTAAVISELLLRYGLIEWTGNCHFELTYGPWGKPYFHHPQDLYFNISHCKEACVCVISDEEVGVDIEVIRSISPYVVRKVCNVKEADLIHKSNKPDEEFVKRWVMKESYAKLLGVGLSRDFRTINTIELEDRFMLLSVKNMYMSVARHKKEKELA